MYDVQGLIEYLRTIEEVHAEKGGVKMNRLRYLVHCAWFYWTKGEPMPVDVHNELLTQWDILPESLYDDFEWGLSVDDVVRKLLGDCVDDDYEYEEGDEEGEEENGKAPNQYEDFVTW